MSSLLTFRASHGSEVVSLQLLQGDSSTDVRVSCLVGSARQRVSLLCWIDSLRAADTDPLTCYPPQLAHWRVCPETTRSDRQEKIPSRAAGPQPANAAKLINQFLPKFLPQAETTPNLMISSPHRRDAPIRRRGRRRSSDPASPVHESLNLF